MDKIIIKDLRVSGIIGVYDYERITPQAIIINVTLFTDTRKAATSDDITDCVNYEKIANMLKAHAQSSQRLTIEALTGDLAPHCLEAAGVQRVNIRVEKTQAIEFTGSVGVEIERENA